MSLVSQSNSLPYVKIQSYIKRRHDLPAGQWLTDSIVQKLTLTLGLIQMFINERTYEQTDERTEEKPDSNIPSAGLSRCDKNTYLIPSNYHTYPYKHTVKQFRSLKITASVRHMLWILIWIEFKWVPTTYAFIKKIRKKLHNHHQIILFLILFIVYPLKVDTYFTTNECSK